MSVVIRAVLVVVVIAVVILLLWSRVVIKVLTLIPAFVLLKVLLAPALAAALVVRALARPQEHEAHRHKLERLCCLAADNQPGLVPQLEAELGLAAVRLGVAEADALAPGAWVRAGGFACGAERIGSSPWGCGPAACDAARAHAPTHLA